MEIARRNDALCEILNFKRYIPGSAVVAMHPAPSGFELKWWALPGNIGRYNSFDLKFHREWNWLMSAVIEILQKYKDTHNQQQNIYRIYQAIAETKLSHIEIEKLWHIVTDYALQILQDIEKERKIV